MLLMNILSPEEGSSEAEGKLLNDDHSCMLVLFIEDETSVTPAHGRCSAATALLMTT